MIARPGAMNIEARALAEALLSEDRNVYQVALEYERENAALARHGGRALTEALGRRLYLLRSVGDDQQRINEVWQYNIDPAYSSWQAIAEGRMSGADTAYMSYGNPSLTQSQAEAMLEWPIYRAAVVGSVLADLHGQASEAEDAILDTLAHCAGIDR